MICTYKQWRI